MVETLDLPAARVEPIHHWPRSTSDWKNGIFLQAARMEFPRHKPGTNAFPRKWRLTWENATHGEHQYLRAKYVTDGVYGAAVLNWTEPRELVSIEILARSFSAVARGREHVQITMEIEEQF